MNKEVRPLGIKIPAFNLQEMLVVLVIIGVLVLIALPNLMPLIAKAKSTEAQLQLKHLYHTQRNYFLMHAAYSTQFDDLGFEPPANTTQGGKAHYEYRILSASNTAFKARATAVSDFDGDGVLNVWEIDQEQDLKEIVKD